MAEFDGEKQMAWVLDKHTAHQQREAIAKLLADAGVKEPPRHPIVMALERQALRASNVKHLVSILSREPEKVAELIAESAASPTPEKQDDATPEKKEDAKADADQVDQDEGGGGLSIRWILVIAAGLGVAWFGLRKKAA